MGTRRVFKTSTLTQANRHRSVMANDAPVRGKDWTFFLCECGQPHCREYVLLSFEAYVQLHAEGRSVLAPGHHSSQTERTRRPREDALALHRQAEHRIRRTTKNLRKIDSGEEESVESSGHRSSRSKSEGMPSAD
jgi:hypothetical protein